MRLWDYRLISYLPTSQLVAQWRELNSVFKKQDNHILINYIYNYPKSTLKTYTDEVVAEMNKRGYKINKWDNYNEYFNGVEGDNEHFKEHDNEYLLICYYNLKEKWLRGQKDFTDENFYKIAESLSYIIRNNKEV